jgi:WD40 repeat protein
LKRRGIALSLALLATLLEQNAAPAAVPPRLPVRALNAAHSAAGHGGAASPGAAELANYVLRGQALLKPVAVAVLAFVLLLGGVGVFVWHKWGPGWGGIGTRVSAEVWELRQSLENHPTLAWGMNFSPDGRLLVTQGGDSVIRVWDTGNWGEPRLLKVDDGTSQAFLAFTPDNRTIVTMPYPQSDVEGPKPEGSLRFWDAESGKERKRYRAGFAAKLAPNGKTLAVIRSDRSVHMIDLADDRDRALPEVRLQPASALAFSADGKFLAVGSTGDTIVLYDAATLQEHGRLGGSTLQTLDLVFSPDGSILAALRGSSANAKPLVRDVEVWSVSAAKRLFTLPRHEALLMAFTPDGMALVTGGQNGVIHFWDPADGTARHQFGGGPVDGRPFRLVFSPDSKSIVAPLANGIVTLRDTKTGVVHTTLRGHSWPVDDAAYSPDGRTLVTGELITRQVVGGGNAQAKVWGRLR